MRTSLRRHLTLSTALVTGATGQVGHHVADRLLREGWTVRALVRDLSAASSLRDRGVELALGDVRDPASFNAAAAGRDIIFHTAAAVTPNGGWDAFRRPNVEGTRNAVAAAQQASARLVHVSSVAVYGGTSRYRAGLLTDESAPLSPLREADFYARSKRESEDIVLQACARGDIWATAVRPDVIYGRHDRQFVPRVARFLRRGFAPLIGSGDTTLAIVHVENVVDGMLRAATSDHARGQVYNLANDFDVTASEFFQMGARGLGVRLRTVHIPYGFARRAERVLRGIARMIPGSGVHAVSFSAVDFLGRNNPFSSQRAREELGWSPHVRPEVGVPDAFAWSREHARG